METLAIVNPRSSNGRTGKQWQSIRRELLGIVGLCQEVHTEGRGHATELARQALLSGVDRVLSVGGDGTHNEIVNGFFDGSAPCKPDAILGIVPSGTGGDFRRTLGIASGKKTWQEVLAQEHSIPVDVGILQYQAADGSSQESKFLNITSFGLGGLVDQKVNQSTKILGGKVSFIIGTLKALARYRNQPIRLRVYQADDSLVLDQSLAISNVAVANGQYFGGGMWVAPKAKIDDGLFDVIIMGDLSKSDVIFKMQKIYKGKHLEIPKVSSLRGSRIEADSDQEVLIDMDGEQPGRLPLRIGILPQAIRLQVAK